MPIAIIKLGSPRKPNEGLRIGTVRRPPRGVPKAQFAKRDFYDVWLPNLSPTPELVAFAQRSQDEGSWKTFKRRFRRDEQAGSGQTSRCTGGALASDKLLRRLLLRGRRSLPSFRSQGITHRARCQSLLSAAHSDQCASDLLLCSFLKRRCLHGATSRRASTSHWACCSTRRPRES